MTETLHLDFNPSSVAWIGDLQLRTRTSSSARIQARYRSWARSGLGELALAIATRLEISKRAETHLRRNLDRLREEIEQSGDLGALLASDCAYRPKDHALLFDICVGIDACFFELRSLYEVLGNFVGTFCSEILGNQITENRLLEVVNAAGVSVDWVGPLRENRKLFFHQTAPWIALEVFSRSPLKCGIAVMKENLSVLDDPSKFVSEKELTDASNGLRQSVVAVREWLKEQIEAEEDKERAAGAV